MATDDNSKLGYCYSAALHIFVAAAMFAYALIDILFPKETTENKIVFEMVEPSDAPPAPPPPPETAPEIKTEKIEDIKPLEIPEPESDPEPEPEQPKQEPEPKPTPAPESIKKIEKPKPKKISFDDFRKKNPKKKSQRKPRTVSRPVKIDRISARTSNIDNISTISTSSASSSSQAMQDALSAYTREIYMLAKRNWKIPTISEDSISARISFKVSRLGIISAIKIVESSGDKDFDRSVIEVFKTITVPPPPDNQPHTVIIRFNAH